MDTIRTYISEDTAKVIFWVIFAFGLVIILIARMKLKAEQRAAQFMSVEIIELTKLMFQYPELDEILNQNKDNDISAKFAAIDNLDMPATDKEVVKKMLMKDFRK